MKPAPFEYRQPLAIGEVLELLASHGDNAKVLAGGQSLVPLMNLRMVAPAMLIDINRVAGLSGVRVADSELVIGAMMRQRALLEDDAVRRDAPLVVEALRHVGHVQTRSRGTIGGSLAHADPAAELPLAMVAVDAVFSVQSIKGTRDIRAREFFHDALTTDLTSSELLVAIRVPRAPAGTRVAFREYARRHGDFAIAAAAVQCRAGDSSIAAAVGGVGAKPRYFPALSSLAASAPMDRARLVEIARREIEAIEPLSDHQASGAYRRKLGILALTDCLEKVMQA